MGQHQQWLIDYIEANPSFVQPDYRRNEVLGFLKSGETPRIYASRAPAARLNWGIPLPFDPDFVTYVWFDALTNYITVPASLGDPRRMRPARSGRNPQPATRFALAGGRPRRRQGHCEVPRRLLAHHAQGGGPSASETDPRARLVAEGRREDQQEHRQHR